MSFPLHFPSFLPPLSLIFLFYSFPFIAFVFRTYLLFSSLFLTSFLTSSSQPYSNLFYFIQFQSLSLPFSRHLFPIIIPRVTIGQLVIFSSLKFFWEGLLYFLVRHSVACTWEKRYQEKEKKRSNEQMWDKGEIRREE